MAEANDHQCADHVVLFPFMAQGHLAPFRCLAALVRRCRPDARVTVVGTSGTADSLRVHLAADDIGVHALAFDTSSGSTGSSQKLIDLFLAAESLRPAFHRFVADLRRSDPHRDVHVVTDMFLASTADGVAPDDPGVTRSVLLTTGGYGAALYFSLWDSVPLVSHDDGCFRPRCFPDICVHRSQLTDHLAAADGGDAWFTFIRRQIAAFSRADALLVNTAEKLEPKGLSMLRQWLNSVPIFPVGPLLREARSSSPSPEETTDSPSRSPIMEWLDKQPPRSVLYVSFGSQYTISASQSMELAMGLEKSGHRFVWVIRPAADVNGGEPSSGLPEGFTERIEAAGLGLVARCWAPQVEVLAHAATGAFLTHCGWNSAQESLAAGVPMLGWPLSAEQFYNAKTMSEEMGVCVELARGGAAVVARDEVAGAVETVLSETSKVRAAMRRKAAKVKKVIEAAREDDGDESSVEVMWRFMDAMEKLHPSQKLGRKARQAARRASKYI